MMQDHVAHLVAPALVNRFLREAPHVRLDVLPWQSPASMNPEYSRSIDLLVSCSLTDIPGFEREALFTDTEVTVVGKEYKAAARLHNLAAWGRADATDCSAGA
jgi:DNA-binding transcriptional LysR family regulator